MLKDQTKQTINYSRRHQVHKQVYPFHYKKQIISVTKYAFSDKVVFNCFIYLGEKKMENINCLVDHWIYTTSLSTFDILNYLIHSPISNFQNKDGYLVILKTPLASPIVLISKQTFCLKAVFLKIIWSLIVHNNCHTSSMFSFVLHLQSTEFHIDHTDVIQSTKQRIKDLLFLDTATIQAFSAQRSDLQQVILCGYKVLIQLFQSPNKIKIAIDTAVQPWKIHGISPFYTCFKNCILNASIAFTCDISQTQPVHRIPPLAVLEEAGSIYMLNKDKYLLLYLLTFATDYSKYLTSPLSTIEIERQGIPQPLASFWQFIYTTSRKQIKPI